MRRQCGGVSVREHEDGTSPGECMRSCSCADSTRSSRKQWLVSQCCQSETSNALVFYIGGERILPGKVHGMDLDIKGNLRVQPYDFLLSIAKRRRSNWAWWSWRAVVRDLLWLISYLNPLALFSQDAIIIAFPMVTGSERLSP